MRAKMEKENPPSTATEFNYPRVEIKILKSEEIPPLPDNIKTLLKIDGIVPEVPKIAQETKVAQETKKPEPKKVAGGKK
jgi:hypothetical protein